MASRLPRANPPSGSPTLHPIIHPPASSSSSQASSSAQWPWRESHWPAYGHISRKTAKVMNQLCPRIGLVACGRTHTSMAVQRIVPALPPFIFCRLIQLITLFTIYTLRINVHLFLPFTLYCPTIRLLLCSIL